MIINKYTGYIISKTEEIPNLPDHIKNEMLHFDMKDWLFIVPNEINDNHLKVVYKVGFLRDFYKQLNPNLSYSDIYKRINSEWQVFKSERQMERLNRKYLKLMNKKEEN